MDKAGAYAVQGLASKFITKVDGDYWNVVGLPIDKLLSVLEQFLDVRAFRSRLAELKRDEIQ
jgi:septum formation protein